MTIKVSLAVSRVRLLNNLISTSKLDCEYLNTSLLEVMIFARDEHVFIWNLSDLALQMILDAWWA
jgi:hypothetical protein